MIRSFRAGALLAVLATPAFPAVTPGSNKTTQSDAAIERAIRARFAASRIAGNKFTVRVQGGVATIEGKTDIVQHKGTATRLAKSAGAAKVVNLVEVGQVAKDKASENLAKGRRRAQVKRGDVPGRN
jgi:hypothetical protein